MEKKKDGLEVYYITVCVILFSSSTGVGGVPTDVSETVISPSNVNHGNLERSLIRK